MQTYIATHVKTLVPKSSIVLLARARAGAGAEDGAEDGAEAGAGAGARAGIFLHLKA